MFNVTKGCYEDTLTGYFSKSYRSMYLLLLDSMGFASQALAFKLCTSLDRPV
jgi:hypothetical protein